MPLQSGGTGPPAVHSNKDPTVHYIIHCLDRPDALPTRLESYAAHRAFLAAPPVRIVISGPLLGEDNETMIGSCFLIEADSLAAARAFNAADPFAAAGVWERVEIHPFLKRTDNRD